jgi:uncharacterized repeat protein (TIGR02543 family)
MVVLAFVMGCFVIVFTPTANAADPVEQKVSSLTQFLGALQFATANEDTAVNIHITADVDASNNPFTIPANVHLFIDPDVLFSVKTVTNKGVLYINGDINHNSKVTNVDDGKVVLGLTGKIRGNTKLLTNGDVIDLRGNWEIKFDANGGTFGLWNTVSKFLRKTGADGYVIPMPDSSPTREGYHIIGWYTDAEGVNQFNFVTARINTLLTSNDDGMTLYAKWAEHDWDEGVVTTNPTCTEPGEKTFTCQYEDCNAEYTAPVGALDHDFVLVTHEDATCEDDGFDYYECSRCDATKTDVIDAIEHTWTVTVIPPTCTEEGYTMHVCANDADHNFNDAPVAALGHDWDDGVVTEAPTFDKAGVMTFTCKRCGEIRTEAIKQLEWEKATKDDAYGTKVASSAQHYYPGDGVEFWWGFKDVKGLQSENGLLIIDESFFSTHSSVTIVVKSSADIQYVKATITESGAYSIVVPKWADAKGKEHNINMVWIRFDDPLV